MLFEGERVYFQNGDHFWGNKFNCWDSHVKLLVIIYSVGCVIE